MILAILTLILTLLLRILWSTLKQQLGENICNVYDKGFLQISKQKKTMENWTSDKNNNSQKRKMDSKKPINRKNAYPDNKEMQIKTIPYQNSPIIMVKM